MTDLGVKFKQAYEKSYSEFLVQNLLRSQIRKTNESILLVSSCIAKSSTIQASYPIIVGNGLSRASVTSIGSFPPYKFNARHIYPMGYTVKKRYKPHRGYKRSIQNKVLYVCTIGVDGMSITADDGHVWDGPGVWEEFSEDVGIAGEFKCIEDFMALNHPTIVGLIEDIGCVSSFDGYVPLSKRSCEEETGINKSI